jgi:hypothetical protein
MLLCEDTWVRKFRSLHFGTDGVCRKRRSKLGGLMKHEGAKLSAPLVSNEASACSTISGRVRVDASMNSWRHALNSRAASDDHGAAGHLPIPSSEMGVFVIATGAENQQA